MNTNQLKSFAQEARIKIVSQVAAKLDYVLTTDSAVLREKEAQVKKLKAEIQKTSKEQVVDKVAYTWFNRLMALRFMDANDYQPIKIGVITPKEGYTLPELLDEAKQGNIPNELSVDTKHIFELLDGTIRSSDAQNEAYKELLIGACNHLNTIFPFLFEKINDYAELLLPDDLTSEFSIVQDIREGMSTEDCAEVEIIGWIYQFYISERKDEVFAAKGKVKKEDIPAATQLFTPRWIVEYMVQNTVGKLWLQNRPNSSLKDHMPYYIESPATESDDFLKINSVEEITLLDQACGSGHILVYGFELLTKIYEEEGYSPSEIPQLIVEKNLYGFEIDERAAQLAGLALMMKAREYHKRVFRKQLTPHILCYQDLKLTTDEIREVFKSIDTKLSNELLYDLGNIQQATNLGSLIVPHSSTLFLEETLQSLKVKEQTNSDLFIKEKLQQLVIALAQLVSLSRKYHCVVDNPPYMGGGNMNNPLADFVKTNYPASKADLMACFMEAGLGVLQLKGYLGMINQHSWMFLSSYERLRKKLIREINIDTLLHLGARTFPEIGGEVVQNVAFTLVKKNTDAKGNYIRLVDDKNTQLKSLKALEAIKNSRCGWYYKTNQNNFLKIPNHPIGYWSPQTVIKSFEKFKKINEYFVSDGPCKSGKDAEYLRQYWEIQKIDYGKDKKWRLCSKGGETRKHYGNYEFVLKWTKECQIHYRKDKIARITSETNRDKRGITWSIISGSNNSFRLLTNEALYNSVSPAIFSLNEESYSLNGMMMFLNSKVAKYYLEIINPTLALNVGNVLGIPINPRIFDFKNESNLEDYILEWNSRETSLDFTQNELVKHKSDTLEESYDGYQQYWTNKFFHLHKNEEELNKQFIDIYSLQEELTPEVPLEDITILKEETDIVNGELVFNAKEVFIQFISYAVGCMFGRYSLVKEGLILANQGETLEDYLEKIATSNQQLAASFMPDDDNIIPVLDDEWFEDDIVGRFYEFLKVTFGESQFEKNLAFIEDCIGKDIRKFFVKDFYNDHIKRYKKRPIYWMFSSPKGAFNVLIYMHRYTPDTLNQILNGYLVEYREKLNTRMEHLDHLIESGTSSEQTKAAKEKDKLKAVLLELQEYEREVLYPLATERITIDLDDGVLVNYNKFGNAIKLVKGLNDKKAKDKVKKFDWIDTTTIK
ncbi:BREX-1 system adenine-specific DNA-methyltransferase PglX [Haloflavibacter putidus]|uniref:site-specific DNA-methyltransferase (adenine-specific) n=1 Tax=Haloflavibacter putidus TaxID=2576776 RepID=A0A507ZZI3_9FLAO|nr:BREX-1 system adenine-specific DNA-methyltransferase PglX [Haloflavibacter putidus]TQD38992.1 BREX-1 system adenine-specific DNA-methyltransferase PglX [Haloflavibacter putidus]